MRHFHRHADGLSKCRVRMNGFTDVDNICAHLNRHGNLADHVASVGADYAAASISAWPSPTDTPPIAYAGKSSATVACADEARRSG